MKTTLDLHDALLIKAKAVAARERTSLTRLIEEGLTLRLRPPAAGRRPQRKVLPVYHGMGDWRQPLPPLRATALCWTPPTGVPRHDSGLGPEWTLCVRLCADHDLAGNDIPDAWIAAAGRAAHEHRVTFDRGFRRSMPARELSILGPREA